MTDDCRQQLRRARRIPFPKLAIVAVIIAGAALASACSQPSDTQQAQQQQQAPDEQARKEADEKAWADAEKAGTAAAYTAYIQNFARWDPNSLWPVGQAAPREKDFHFEYHALFRKIRSEIGPVSDLPYRKQLCRVCALEDAARDAFEIYSLIVCTTLEVGRVSVIGPFNCFRMASS
jgi:hypothetical protein